MPCLKERIETNMRTSAHPARPLMVIACTATALAMAAGAALAAPPKKASAAKKPPVKAQDTSRGVQQMQGGDGVFGTVYTLNNDFNFEILSARYSVEPFNSYSSIVPAKDEKLLLLTVAIKNAASQDEGYNPEANTFTAVDTADQDYQGWDYRLASQSVSDSFYPNLKPGQGLGQNPAADELTVAILVPAKAKIQKIILNRGRKAVTDEKVVRYFIAGAASGNPKNVIQPLPASIRDPQDTSGAVCADPGRAALGVYVPSGAFAYRLDSVEAPADAVLSGDKAEDGKKFVVATISLKNIAAKDQGIFEAFTDSPSPVLLDTDGEKYVYDGGAGPRKAKRDEKADDRTFKPGEEYTVRCFFVLPKDATPKTLILGRTDRHQYAVDLSAAKTAAAAAP